MVGNKTVPERTVRGGNYPTERDLSENARRPRAAAQEHWDILLGKPGMFILSLCQEITNIHSRS